MRRRFLLAPAAALLLAGCASTVPGAGTLRGGASRSSGGGTPTLVVKWQRALPGTGGADDQLQGGSADSSRLYVSSLDGQVFALSRANGAVEWHQRAGHRAPVGVGVAGGTVFYFDEQDGTSALDPVTGRARWHRKTYYESNSTSYQPPYAGGVVALKDDTGIVGLDPRSGAVRWTVSRDDYTIGNHAPVTDGHTFYAVVGDIDTARDTLAAISATTGKVLWQVTTPDQDADYTAFTAGSTVLLVAQLGDRLSSPTTITAVDTTTHKVRWTTRTTGAQPNLYAPVGTATSLVFPTDKGVQGIALRDGSISFDTELEGGIGSPKMAHCGDRVCTVAFEDVSVIDDAGAVIRQRKAPGATANAVLESARGTFLYTPSTVYSLN